MLRFRRRRAAHRVSPTGSSVFPSGSRTSKICSRISTPVSPRSWRTATRTPSMPARERVADPSCIAFAVCALLALGCFPQFDLPPGEALPDGRMLAPAGRLVPLDEPATSCDIAAELGQVAVASRSSLAVIDLSTASTIASLELSQEVSAVRFFARGKSLLVLRSRGDAIDFWDVSN